MERETDPLLNQSSSYGTTGGNALTTPSDNDTILNTDEYSLTDEPLRSDLETGMSSDVSSGVTSGPDFSGNLDSDSDAGLSSATTGVTDPYATYAIPSAINEYNETVETPLITSTAQDAADTAKEKVGDAKVALSDAAGKVKEQAGQLAEQAKSQVSTLTAQATDKVKEQISDKKTVAAEGLSAITEAIMQSASSLEQNGQAPIANAVTGFATKIDDFAGYLQSKSVDELAADVSTYAKQNPQVFVGGAFLLGIAIARFLKSSNRNSLGYNNSAS